MEAKVRGEWTSERIRDLRATKEWTQEEMARELGTTQTVISFWETGRTRPSGGFRRLLDQMVTEVTA